ncbi:unnamed protein product [Vitrella brassicaformis CCMP3155]|uniref:SOUL heme-binding protein n=2 Tax=Vitrella brassicaformis TaxID=1169539 RepID=A0A0G4EPU8_VITBC|nr:unnamed protein product [Vitrella brassicaformis CCMP3155]|eukprot:CEL99295.1 unnamed protein product [Vitrella brassicaformis CCMP3155]
MASLLESAKLVFGACPYEKPAYKVLLKKAQYEVRQYSKYIVVTSKWSGDEGSAGSKGFFPLFRYILGGKNEGKPAAEGGQQQQAESIAMTAPVIMTEKKKQEPQPETIAMTAPVLMTGRQETPTTTETKPAATEKTMSFILPSKYQSISELPKPTESGLEFSEVAPQTYAVMTFSWLLTPKAVSTHAAALRELCAADGVELDPDENNIITAGYNPPFTLPFLRRNEVWIRVTNTDALPKQEEHQEGSTQQGEQPPQPAS